MAAKPAKPAKSAEPAGLRAARPGTLPSDLPGWFVFGGEMHELGLVMEMVALAESELARTGCVAPVRQLNLTVGRLSGASPEALQTAFELIARQKGWPEARLVITETAATCLCRACGRASEITELTFTCPRCGDPVCEIQGGRDLQLSSIDVED